MLIRRCGSKAMLGRGVLRLCKLFETYWSRQSFRRSSQGRPCPTVKPSAKTVSPTRIATRVNRLRYPAPGHPLGSDCLVAPAPKLGAAPHGSKKCTKGENRGRVFSLQLDRMTPSAGTFEAGATGLEPATSGVTGRRSNQLNYAP